jgi:hypothetical protein
MKLVAPWTAAARRRLGMMRSDEEQGGVEPPQSKVLRTAIFMRPAVRDTGAKGLGEFTGQVRENVETPGGSGTLPRQRARCPRYSSWHGHPGHDGSRAGCPCHSGQDARATAGGMAILAMTVHGQDARATADKMPALRPGLRPGLIDIGREMLYCWQGRPKFLDSFRE